MIFLIILLALNMIICINAAETTKNEKVKVQPLSTLASISPSVKPLATSSYAATNAKISTTSSPVISTKPLATSSTMTPILSTTTDNILQSKTQERPNTNKINLISLKPTKFQDIKKQGYEIDYEELDKLFDKFKKPNSYKLSNKELLDKIFQMILKNKHVDVNCGSYHCLPGPHEQKNEKAKEKIIPKPYGGFQEPITGPNGQRYEKPKQNYIPKLYDGFEEPVNDGFLNFMTLAKDLIFNDNNYNFDKHIMQPIRTPNHDIERFPFVTTDPQNKRIWLD